jgi:predicted ATPase
LSRIIHQKALQKSGFVSAATYMNFGLGYLGGDGWSKHFKLTLELSSGAAEAAYCSGNFDEMQKHLDQVMKQDCDIHDKVRAYRTLILSLGAQERFGEAIDNGIHILKEMKVSPVPVPTAYTDASQQTFPSTHLLWPP